MSMEALESSTVSRSLLTEMTTWGVDDWLFVMNLEIALLMAMILRIYSWVLIAVALHFVLMVVTKMVPNILIVYAKYLRQAERYCARFSTIQKRGFRPLKLGRGAD
jgi:type IV secretory pathway VirB3-like protein